MAEATTTVLACGVAGTFGVTCLSLVGMDVPSLAGGLVGCVVVHTLLPAEKVDFRTIAAVTVGSMLFAALAAPWAAPFVAKAAPPGVSGENVRVCSAALLAAFPKPILIALQRVITKIASKFDVA